MYQIDLSPIIAAARAFREVLRHHIELSTTPGYDPTLGWHQINTAANRVTELLVRRDGEGQFADSLAANYCNVLEVCIERLIGNMLEDEDWDQGSIAGIAKAIEALESHHARRQVDCREKQNPEAAVTPPPSGTLPEGEKPAAKAEGLSAENRAMAIALQWAKEGRPLRISDIAREAECARSYLYRCKPLRDFLDAAERKGKPPGGSKHPKTRSVEAWRDDD
jgi:hypothetical protein